MWQGGSSWGLAKDRLGLSWRQYPHYSNNSLQSCSYGYHRQHESPGFSRSETALYQPIRQRHSSLCCSCSGGLSTTDTYKYDAAIFFSSVSVVSADAQHHLSWPRYLRRRWLASLSDSTVVLHAARRCKDFGFGSSVWHFHHCLSLSIRSTIIRCSCIPSADWQNKEAGNWRMRASASLLTSFASFVMRTTRSFACTVARYSALRCLKSSCQFYNLKLSPTLDLHILSSHMLPTICL